MPSMLIAAMFILGFAVIAGLGVGSFYIMTETPAPALRWQSVVHALGGAAGFAVLLEALHRGPPSPHAIRMGAGGFGVAAAGFIGVALAIGLLVLILNLVRRRVSIVIVATHGMVAIVGYALLLAYVSMLR